MIKVLCDRCKAEIPEEAKIWRPTWWYRENILRKMLEEYEESTYMDVCFCEKCKCEIEEFMLKKPKSTAKKKKEVDHERILQLHNDGMPNKEIAKELGITTNVVSHSLEHKSEVCTDPEMVIDLYKAGWKVHDIAEETKGSEEEVKKIILRAAAEEAS